MDNHTQSSELNVFSSADRKEIGQFLEQEKQKAKFQENVHSLTAMCWTKCVTGKIVGNSIDRTEGSCLENCVNRYIDAQKTVISLIEQIGRQ
ncbi:Tim10/DDP family zinc finger-domain-containing protein [Geopyxis carbonaria]|nr:Tim10/DDP family zinc finger-domain-containing protein [Geopyxis carbonaria]